MSEKTRSNLIVLAYLFIFLILWGSLFIPTPKGRFLEITIAKYEKNPMSGNWYMGGVAADSKVETTIYAINSIIILIALIGGSFLTFWKKNKINMVVKIILLITIVMLIFFVPFISHYYQGKGDAYKSGGTNSLFWLLISKRMIGL